MAQVALSKQEREWNKQLTQHLDKYSYLRDWSELAAWLSKLKHHLSEVKTTVLDKGNLLKRLATSLNASLPVALLQSTLQIYQILFARFIITGDQLQTTCIGLFSFYLQANIKNKSKIIEIFTKYLPVFGTDLQILATGLVITILPSLNEMQESLIKDINNFLEMLFKVDLVGPETMAEALWVAVLRSPSCRVAGLKYLSNKLGRGAQEQENDQQDNFWQQGSIKSQKREQSQSRDQQIGSSTKIKDIQQKDLLKQYCPHIQTLIMNSIAICIEDSNILAIKAGLDFLYKYLPLRSQAISHPSKLRIAKSVVWLLGKRDTSVTRKINLWLFGKPDQQNRYAVNQKQLCYITQAMIDFLQTDATLQPLKIAFNLLSEHQQLPVLILHQLTPYLLQFCQKQEGNSEALKIMYRLVQRLRPHLTLFSRSLSQGLIKSIKQKRFDDSQKMLNLSIFFLNKILKPEEVKSQVKPFLKMMLQSSVLTCWQHRQFMKLCLRQTLQLLQKHKELLKSLQTQKQQLDLLTQHNTLYENLLQNIFEKENQVGSEDQIFLINRVIVKIEEVFNVYNEKWMPNLVNNIALSNPQHFIAPIQVIGQAFQKQGRLKEQISIRAKDPTKNNCLKVCMAKMWGILSLGHLQGKVIPLLLKFIKFYPGFFQKLLETQFQSSGQLAIIKFRLFWEVGPKYPQIMNGDQVEEISKFGLFKMLQFLDSGNPLVKYHSNLWISETFPAYHRIMNPILQTLLKPKQCWYLTPQGQFIYAVSPETKQVLQTLRHLKSFIRLVPQKFNKFAFKPLTPKILPYYQIFRGQDPSEQGVEISYIAALVKLVVRFTETKFVSQQNQGIDLSSCQLLEVIVRNINSPQMSNFLLKEHFKSLLRSLHFATINQEHLLQIQLLNLLKLILIDSEVRKLSDHKILREAIGQNSLTTTILQGVACSFPYIKQRFVQFLNQCVPLMLEYHPNCGEVISRVINTYSTKIAYVNSKKVQASSLKDLQISQKNAQILILFQGITELLSHFLNLHLRPFQKQKNQYDTDSGLFCFYSWKSYTHLKIHKKPQSSRGKRIIDQIAKQLINQLPSLIAIMAACWTFSQLKPHYRLKKEGLAVFNYETFLIYNKALGGAQSRLETEQSVQSFIINLLRVLLNTYPEQTMRAIVTCWSLAFKDVETKLKILELLTFSCLPIQHFYAIMTQSINPEKIGKKRKALSLELERNVEQDILQICQTFSHYNFQNPSLFQAHNLMSIWMAFCKFIKFFDNTKNVLTLFCLVELVDLFISKNNPKEIIRDQKLKKQLISLVNIHSDIILICSGKLKIQISVKPIRFNSILPLPSSVYQIHHDIKTDPTQLSPSYLQWDQVPSAKGAEYCRLLGLIIAKRVCYNILASLQNDTEIMLVKKVREIAIAILPLIQDKDGNGLLVEGASQLILGILQKKHVFVKELKHQILQIFNKEDFFICSSRTLQSWAKIIELLIDNNKDHDIFQEYLEKVSLASSLFSSYTFETKKKIKSFERICFILYSGKKDKYNQKAHQLIDKIIEVIKNAEAPQPVLILIFFCIRILILRLSADKLTKLLSNLWQMIIFLLNSIFSQEAHKDRLHLHWAALKLIEMISLMQIAQFHPHQWIFFYDFVGVKLSHVFDASTSNQIKLGVNPKIHKFLPQDIHLVRQEIGAVQEKRHLIIKEDKIDDIELLKTKALLLSSYLIASNGYRMKFDMREVQQLIDNDFLNLDQFIFKVK